MTAANISGLISVTVDRVSGPSASITGPVNPAPGELTKIAYATANAVGTLRLQASATINGNLVQSPTHDIVVTAAPATTATLSVQPTGTNGVAATVTITLNAAAGAGGLSFNLSATNSGTLGSATVNIAQGATTGTTTITRASSGTSQITMTGGGGVTLLPVGGVSFTSSAANATGFNLSISPNSGVTGATTATVSVAPVGGAIPAGGITVTLALSGGGALGATTLNFAAGSTSPQTTTITRSADGTSTVTMTNNGGLANGSPSTYVSGSAGAAQTAPAAVLNENGSTATHFVGVMALKEGDIPAGNRLTCPAATTFQGVVTNRWPDGSVKTAVVAGTGSFGANSTTAVSISGEAGSLGAPVAESVLIGAAPNAVISFSGVGSVALADLLGVASTLSGGRFTAGRVRTNFEGPVCSSWTYYSRIAGHPHLAAWFEVQCWADGSYKIWPWIENGWWNVAAPQAYIGTASFSLGGVVQKSQPMLLHHHARPALALANAEAYGVGATFAAFVHNPAYLQQTDQVSAYEVVASETTLSQIQQDYDWMLEGNEATSTMPYSMGGQGYTESIGIHPEVDVCYITTADKRARRGALVFSTQGSRYASHYRDETTNEIVAPGAYANWVLNSSGAGISSVSASHTNQYTPTPTPTVVTGVTLAGSTTTVINLDSAAFNTHNEVHRGWPLVIGGETRTVLSYNAATRQATVSSPFSTAPAAGAAYTLTLNGTPYVFAVSHHPSIGYMAYMATGLHYFIEELQSAAAVACYRMQTVYRQGASHLFRGDLTDTGLRGCAWATRSVAQAASLTPESQASLKAALLSVLHANIDFNHATYVAQPNNPFGWMAEYDSYTPPLNGTVQSGATRTVIPLGNNANNTPSGYVNWWITVSGESVRVIAYDGPSRTATLEGTGFSTAPASGTAWSLSDRKWIAPWWMHDFMTAAQGHQLCIAPIDSTRRTKLHEFFQWKGRSAVGRLGAPGVSTAFNFRRAAQFQGPGAPADLPDFNGGTGPWYANWGEIYEATFGFANTADPGGNDALLTGSDNGSYPVPQGSFAILMGALAFCVRWNVPGADVARARVRADAQWSTWLANLADNPVWGLKPRDPVLPMASQALNSAIDYSLNRISDIDPGPTTSREGDYTQAGAAELFTAWGGMAWSPWRSRGYFMGNGHGSGCANDVYQFDAYTRLFSIIKPRAPWSVVQFTAGAKTWESDSTATVIALQPNMSSALDGAYGPGWTLQIGAETRNVVSYQGGLVRRVTVDSPFSVAPVNAPYVLSNGSTTIGMLTQSGTSTTAIVLPSSANASDGYHYAHQLRIGSATASIGPYPGYIGATRTANLTTPIAGAAPGLPVYIDALTGYIADNITGWHWSNKKGISVDVGQPFGAHTYGWTGTLPPNALTPNGPANTAPDGYYYTPGNSTMPLVGSDGTGQMAVLPIGAALFQALGTAFASDPAHGGSLFDVYREEVVQFTDSNTATKEAVHVRTGVKRTINLGAVFYAYSAICAHSERHDLYTGIVIPSAAEGAMRLFFSDRRFNVDLPFTTTGTPPAQQGSGRHYTYCWVEPWQCWAVYAADGSNTIHFLKLPANPRAASPMTLTWVQRTITGTVYSNYTGGPNPPYNRFAAIREACGDTEGFFMWFPLVNQPAQRFRVARP